MIKSVLKCETVCRDAVRHGNVELFLSDEQWTGLLEIRDTLKPAFIANKKLQARNLTLPDVRKILDIAHSQTAALGV